MSLASERQAGRLICTCPAPMHRQVVLFRAIVLTDVHECAICGRLIVRSS